MDRLPTNLQLFGPATLGQFALGCSLRDFVVAYGDTSFLLVSVEDTDIDLRRGLVACEQVTGASAKPTLTGAGWDTGVGEVTQQFSTRGIEASAGKGAARRVSLDEGGLATALRLRRHYAISLRKRTATETEPRITIGRSRSRDIVLKDARVSKFHAWFEMDDAGIFHLADAGSTNGTFLDGELLPSASLTEVIEGRSIHFGGVHAFLVRPPTLWKALQRH